MIPASLQFNFSTTPSPRALENGRTERTAMKVTGLALLSLTFQTLGELRSASLFCDLLIVATGIIYSDIGTSPLYTLNSMWPASGPVPSKEDVVGGISAIIRALSLLPLLKYAR